MLGYQGLVGLKSVVEAARIKLVCRAMRKATAFYFSRVTRLELERATPSRFLVDAIARCPRLQHLAIPEA